MLDVTIIDQQYVFIHLTTGKERIRSDSIKPSFAEKPALSGSSLTVPVKQINEETLIGSYGHPVEGGKLIF